MKLFMKLPRELYLEIMDHVSHVRIFGRLVHSQDLVSSLDKLSDKLWALEYGIEEGDDETTDKGQ